MSLHREPQGRPSAAGCVWTVLVVAGLALAAWMGQRLYRQVTQPTSTPVAAVPTATATATPTPLPSPTPTATATATPSPTPTATLTPTPTAVITATVSPAPSITPRVGGGPSVGAQPGRLWPTPDVSQARDHYWLARVTGPGTQQWASPFYPYGSNNQGRYLLHQGADIPNPLGTPLLAPADGKVVFAGTDDQIALGPTTNFFGNAVVIELDRRYLDRPVYVLMGHMGAVYVRPGERVVRGLPVGEVGMTGIALGPHVHIEVRVGANDHLHTRNPEFWLQPLPDHGALAGRVLTEEGLHLPGVEILLYPGPEFKAPRYYTWTYLDAPDLINPDDQWGENFLMADVPAGLYMVEVKVGKRLLRQEVTIEAGRTAWIEVRATP